MDLSQYAELFRAETREHLSTLNQLLLEWEAAPADGTPVAGLFRAMHTIKGMAATMGYAQVADLAHRAENVLEHYREGDREAAPDVLELLFRTADALEDAAEAAVAGRPVEVGGLLDALDEAAMAHQPPERRDQPPRRISFVNAPVGGGRRVEVIIRADSQLKGARAVLVLKRAAELGEVHSIEPALAAIENEAFEGRFAFRIESAVPAEVITDELSQAGDVESVRLGIERHEADERAERGTGGRSRHVRVDLRRLNTLMNLIGELVTTRSRLAELSVSGEPELQDTVVKVSQLTQALQTEIIQARMTPVWQVFDRFPRLVRDVSRQLGKQVEFRVEGKEIELDRAILDEIGDPLMHLLRNAMDHGIEAPEERVALGKPPTGKLVLAALRERSNVAIMVSDDGRGIDRTKVLAAARRSGSVAADVRDLSDDMLIRELARSGFSTAEEVSDVSGRGVGVDVVVSRMRALGGSVEIESEPGQGTTFILRLPETLAIVKALITRVGEEQYALPLTHVAETVALKAPDITRLDGRDSFVLRERVLPLVNLREVLKVPGEPPASLPVIVLQVGDRRSGLVVDAMSGQQEIVVKNFDSPRGTLPYFSGATILGNGEPVLILDAGGLV